MPANEAIDLPKPPRRPSEPGKQAPGSPAPPKASAPAAPPRDEAHDSYAVTAFGEVLDHASRASVARLTGGLSPAALMATWADWAIHLSSSPGTQQRLFAKAMRKNQRLMSYVMHCARSGGGGETCIEPLPHDRRFRDEAWDTPPFNVIHQSFLLTQQWWHNATTGIRGVTKQHERAAEFAARQVLDMVSPSNFLATNPELLARTRDELGQNLVRGAQNFWQDFERLSGGKPPVGAEAFPVGGAVAAAPGKVVHRNRLIELIQYAPTTDKVRPEPVLITPAWIMKYYILDLSPENSMVRHLTDQGYTVFMISWKNPGPEERDLGMDDYLGLGPLAALDAVQEITGSDRIHAVGYCIGGTLLSIAAAAMARDGDDRLASMTHFATQCDFTEAGELMLFISESEVSFLEDMMWEQGFLDAKQMAGAFQLLRSNDLIWSRILREYLMGERAEMIDLMAWNADTTRMPYRMHSEYLRKLFLNNELATGKYEVEGRAVALSDIRAPIFAVGTETDHVAPWKSAFKIHALTDTEVTFVLTNGGHNAGVISEPGHPGRRYRVHASRHDDRWLPPGEWAGAAERKDGSWWPEWTAWLAARSGARGAPPPMGAPLCDAPGTYVHEQ